MNNSNYSRKVNYPNTHHTPRGYELDEIKWDEGESEYPINPDLIPFENSTKKLRKELARFVTQHDKK